MVIANSTWVRPAQALIHSESGEVRYFPPRNRGSLPRALTFCDHPTHDHDPEMMPPFEFLEIGEQDYLITSESENFHLEDPPDEYTSFERDYSRHSSDILLYSCMDQEAPSMSTPTDQYVNNMLMRKGHPKSQQSVLSPRQLPYLSSASDTQNDCTSPLLQSEPGPCLSLDDLVELYTRKLQMAKATTSPQVDMPDPKSANASANENSMVCRIDEMDRICDGEGNSMDRDQHANPISPNGSTLNVRNPMPLMAIDMRLYLQKLDEICLGAGQQKQENGHYEGWLRIPIEEFESILMNCCRESYELVFME